tara:strand:- start:350 stop:679 length:330 start_codon:yes stop_codon:yes gene_type:complete
MIIETNHEFYEWFSVDGYRGVPVILDHNMVFRYIGNSIETSNVLDIVNQILIEMDLIGDINSDEIINIQDIILLINIIFSNEYIPSSDINNDGNINILDIIELVGIILR